MKVSRGSLTMTVELALTLVGSFPGGASGAAKPSGEPKPWGEVKPSGTAKSTAKKPAPLANARKAQRRLRLLDYYSVKNFVKFGKQFGPDSVNQRKLSEIAPYADIKIADVTQDDLKFGERQLTTMLRDRPRMASFVKKGDAIWNWTLRQFAGEGLGNRINWNRIPPADDFLGNNSYDSTICEIRILEVLRGEPVPGEMQWAVTVFELINIRGHENFNAYYDEVLAGKLTRKEYIRKMTEQEFSALHQQRAFYKSMWIPHAKRNKLSHTPYYWKIDAPNNYREWMVSYRNDPHYPECYGMDFDNAMPFVKTKADEITKADGIAKADEISKATAQVRAGRNNGRQAISDEDYSRVERMASSMESEFESDDVLSWSTKQSEHSLGSGWSSDSGAATNAETRSSNSPDDLLVLNKGIVEVQKTKEIESIEGLGRSLYLSGKFKEAAPFYEQAADIRLHDVGSAHLDYATAITNLALIYCQIKRFDDAERLYKQALEIRERANGEQDAVKITLRHLIALYHSQGQPTEEASLRKRLKMIEDREELDATDDEGVSTDKVEWMKAPFAR